MITNILSGRVKALLGPHSPNNENTAEPHQSLRKRYFCNTTRNGNKRSNAAAQHWHVRSQASDPNEYFCKRSIEFERVVRCSESGNHNVYTTLLYLHPTQREREHQMSRLLPHITLVIGFEVMRISLPD